MLLLLSSGVWRGWKWSHRGMALQGFGKGGAILPKRNWAKSSRPCPGKTPRTLGSLGWRGMRLILSTLGLGTASARPGEGELAESGVKIGKSRSQGSPLCWTDNLVFNRQSAVAMKLLQWIKGVSCWGRAAGKPARPPCAAHCSP